MSDTKPQACPKCGAPASVKTYHVHCSSSDCRFSHILFRLDDWNRLRYVSEAEETIVKRLESRLANMERFYTIRFDAMQKAQTVMREPERTTVCNILANGKASYAEAAPKPRRMKGCPSVGTPGAPCELFNHEKEHDETGFCKMIHPQSWCHKEKCQPVEAEQTAAPESKGLRADFVAANAQLGRYEVRLIEKIAEIERLRKLCARFHKVMLDLHYGRMPDEVQAVVDEAGAAGRGEG